MLDPDVVLSTVVSAFRSIPDLVAELANSPANVIAHTYSWGDENSLARAIYQMTSPSVLVAYLDLLQGNFSGAHRWKHRLEVYIRPKNAATGSVVGSTEGVKPAASPPHLWWLMMNRPINSGPVNIRDASLLSGALIMDNAVTLLHRQDEMQADFFVGSMTFLEQGDS